MHLTSRLIVALVLGQLGLHATMAGLRMAAQLQVLDRGHGEWAVGVLLALFGAAPLVTALYAGRMADRHGFHRPVRLAAVLGLAALGLAAAAASFAGWLELVLLGAAAMLAGTSANVGMLTVQRTAGLAAGDATERVRVFSWLGVAPAFANVLGPVSVGFAIDAAGHRAAYLVLLVLPLVALASARAVPPMPPDAPPPQGTPRRAWDLLADPRLRRLLIVNWLLSTCWDVHAFAVPVLGHERGYAASTIGLVLGTFTLAVTGLRLLIPLVAHRLREASVLRASMIGTGVVFAAYPLAPSAGWLAALAVLLGVTLGCVQPMVMSMLHALTPAGRHGEALALRSMTINGAGTLMPLVFGVTGAFVGAAGLFWIVGAAVVVGSRWAARLAPTRPGDTTPG